MTGHQRTGSLETAAVGLCTDLYELRMVQSYLRRGMTAPATFSLFVRPAAARPWYVTAGLRRVIELLETFRYGPAEVDYLASIGVDEATRAWLAELEPTGEIWGLAEGTVALANEPLLEITAPLPFAQLLETAVVNLVQHPMNVATKAARVALAADGRRLADFGFRRAHGLESGVEAAWAAYLGGGMATSNVEAGRRFGIPVTGTMAHSYVQAFPTEHEAFSAFAADHPDQTVLLVDTYDTLEGVRTAIAVAGELAARGKRLRAVRLDSGPIGELAAGARSLLDEAGLHEVEIFASGGMDEHRIHRLVQEGAPIDAFGVGSALVVAADQPALDIVYKLVAYDGRPVAKYSDVKRTLPGPKQVLRSAGPDSDVLTVRDGAGAGTPLLEPVWVDGEAKTEAAGLDELRARVGEELARLPEPWRRPPYPEQPPVPTVSDELAELSAAVEARPHA